MHEKQSLNRREFMIQTTVVAGTAAVGSAFLAACGEVGENVSANPQATATSTTSINSGGFQLPSLGYSYQALEPYIDAQTMQLHHDKHHATYVKNLNEALKGHPAFLSLSIEDVLRRLNELPSNIRMAVRNNGGGHANHSLFWKTMKPNGGGQPSGKLADAITSTFGSFARFQKTFNDAGAKVFGSGWVWLVSDKNRKLQVITTANQDSPILRSLTPIMGNDVWEHAYYLKYHNVRADYLAAWWHTLNWEEIGKRYQ
jgi:Fe-Mn family superoxide dismutase